MPTTDKLLERMKLGNGLVIYGVNPEHAEAIAFANKVCEAVDDCPRYVISQGLQEIDNAITFQNFLTDIEAARSRVRKGLPFLFMVHATLEALSGAKGDIFQDDLTIDRICVADGLVSLSRSDLFVIPNAKNSFKIFQRNEVPQTPIESELSKAMTEVGLRFEEQVRLGRFTADFVVNDGTTSLVVEADGAEFHDADADILRDREILEKHGFQTLRFTGSKIVFDAHDCAQEVERFLHALAATEILYRYENLEQLDTSQQKAVEHSFGHARVLAPAGSGKTRVLVNRLSYLLNRGVKPGALLTIAFNRKAAEQLKDRLAQLGIPVADNLTDRSGITVLTFNALGYRLLMTNGFSGSLLTSDSRVRKLVLGALKRSGIRIPSVRGSDNLNRVIKQLARVCQGLVNPNAEELELMDQKGQTAKLPFPPIYSAIRDLQADQRLITFDDQIFNALTLAMSEPLVRRELQKRFQYILVDEYQDLNKAQISLIRMLACGNSQVFAVGDDDQLIYSWREAKTRHLLEDFERFFPGTITFALETNYRCAKRIVEPSQRLITYNENRFPKMIKPSPSAPDGDVAVYGLDNIKSQSQKMVAFLKDHHKPDVCDWIDMAVLTRTKVQLVEVARALDDANIPRSSLPDIPLFSSPIGRVLQRYLIIIHSPSNASGEDFAFVINRPNRYTSNDFRDSLSRSPEPIAMLLDYVENAFPENERYRTKAIKTFLTVIQELNGQLGNRSVFDTVRAVISAFDLASVNLDGTAARLDESDDESILEIIAEEARRFQHFDEFLEYYSRQIRRDTGENDEAEETGEREGEVIHYKDANTSGDVVSLNTIHATKGKEWYLCFIFDIRDNPPRGAQSAQASPAETEEERRVFYVGITRARHALGVTTRTRRPSPFLREAFLSREIEDAGIASLLEAVHREETNLAESKGIKCDFQSEVRQLNERAAFIQTEDFRAEIKAQIEELKKKHKELEEKIDRWRNTAPDGIIKRSIFGGFSMSDIELRISNFIDSQGKLDAKIHEATEKISQGSSFVDGELGRLELRAKHIQRQIDLCDGNISKATQTLNDAKNAYEVLRLFQ
jgi:DNA helicase II / ATP-dependent DNA helicase PcrA